MPRRRQRKLQQTHPPSARVRNAIDKVTRTMNSSSKYFDTEIWSPRPFRLLVFNTRSRASACPDAGSRGRSLILVSVGSPASGNTFSHRIFSEGRNVLTRHDRPVVKHLQTERLALRRRTQVRLKSIRVNDRDKGLDGVQW